MRLVVFCFIAKNNLHISHIQHPKSTPNWCNIAKNATLMLQNIGQSLCFARRFAFLSPANCKAVAVWCIAIR
jgi:hypothetical protein